MFGLKEKEERCPHLLAVRGAQILHRERDVWIRGRFWEAAQEWKNAPNHLISPHPLPPKKAYGPIAYNSSQDWPWSVSQAFSLGIQVRKSFLSPLIQRAVSPVKKSNIFTFGTPWLPIIYSFRHKNEISVADAQMSLLAKRSFRQVAWRECCYPKPTENSGQKPCFSKSLKHLYYNPNPNPNPNPQYADQDIVRVKIEKQQNFFYLHILFSIVQLTQHLYNSTCESNTRFHLLLANNLPRDGITRGVTQLSLWAAAFVGWHRTNEVPRAICKIPWAWITYEFAVGLQRMFPTVLYGE